MTNLQNYILSCIDGENYNKVLSTNKDKINFVMDCFKSEYLHANNERLYKINPSKVLCEWLQGLPSSVNIAFYNHEILNLGVLFDLIPASASEDQEDEFLSQWFEMIASEILSLKKAELVCSI